MEESIHDSKKTVWDNFFRNGSSQKTANAREQAVTSERSFICDSCGKKFTNNSNFNRHLRIHTGEKPYECEVCNKRFSQKGDLKAHARVHTGEKPYECSICKGNFSHSNRLKTHMRIHTGEKPYECTICEKKFSQKEKLKRHMTIHTGEKPFECNICKKTFSKKDDLNTHMRTHTGEKPYECIICTRKFSRKSHLNVHMRIHTGEKPHECNICLKRFAREDVLKSHRKIHAGEKLYIPEEVVIQPSGSLEMKKDDDDIDIFRIKEEIPDGFDSEKCSDHEGKLQDSSERKLDGLNPVAGHAVSCKCDGSSYLTGSDRGSGNGYSFKNKAENVCHDKQEKLWQMVETVIDDSMDSQVKIEKSESPNNACAVLELEQQTQLLSGDTDYTEKNKSGGYIDGGRKENCYSNLIMADKNTTSSEEQVFNIQRVYVVETKNSGNPYDEDRKDFQHHLSDNILVLPKEEREESLSPLNIKEEPTFL